MTKPNELAEAKRIETDLNAKREAALTSLAGIEDRRAALSYDAHVQGGEAAKALAKVNAERAATQGRVEELNHAIKEAAERLRIPRGTLYEEIKRIRKVFADHGLADYLKE